MSRRTLLSTFLALFVMTIAMLVTGANTASAQQNPNCCTYTVDISPAIPSACFPFKLYTRWNCNPGIISKGYFAPGITIEPINPPLLPPCPPACRLLGISLDGVNFILPNQTKNFTIGGCCYILNFGFDSGGCIYIKIGKC